MTAEQARNTAAAIIDRIKVGGEPMPETAASAPEPTVADLAERFLRTHVAVECKATTMETYRQRLDSHILPALGEMPVGSVEREHVPTLHHALREKQATANSVLWILSKMFSLAEAWGLRPTGRNPCRRVRQYKSRYRERFLSREEY